MAPQAICELLRALGGPESAQAWREFLDQFSVVLHQAIVFTENDSEAQADCFVFACERLAENQFRRLRKFDPAGAASFPTWLRAVVHNLCIDWHRKNHGRWQCFAWTSALDAFDQEVFRSYYEHGQNTEQIHAALLPNFPTATRAAVEESVSRLGAQLSWRERWLLSTRTRQFDSLEASAEQDGVFEIPDLRPNPESVAMEQEYRESLERALNSLSAPERLLIQLRFEQDLTLSEIARLTGLKDGQTADRKIRAAIEVMRNRMTVFSPRICGKAKAASV